MIQIPLLQTLFVLMFVGAIQEPATEGQLVGFSATCVVASVTLAALAHKYLEIPMRGAVRRGLSARVTS